MLGPDATAEQLHEYISHLKGYAGVFGYYDFNKYPQRGLGEDNTLVTRWIPETKIWKIDSELMGIPFKQ